MEGVLNSLQNGVHTESAIKAIEQALMNGTHLTKQEGRGDELHLAVCSRGFRLENGRV